jgi:outer membrane receptor protein involved in Fe transport
MRATNGLISLFFLLMFPLGLQARQNGAVSGAVLDARTGQSVRNVKIAVDGVAGADTTTDIDGIFRLELAPGRYKLHLSAEGFVATTLDQVDVVGGRTIEVSTVLAGKGQGETVDVVERLAPAATAEAMIVERRLAPVVSDSLSSEEIRNTVASDAAGVLEKVTGVSVVDSGYVYVRGLGERYSATMLNNAILPTTEPERRVVPLDLFPASLIDSIKVLKSYSADLPGEFSAGLVQLQTVEFPVKKTLSVGISNSFNSLTTFKRFGTYPGGQRDFLGFDDGTRGLPSQIPQKRLFPGSFTSGEFQTLGRAFAANWAVGETDSQRPSQSYSISGGDTFGKVGLVGAFTFSNTPLTHDETQSYYRVSGGKPVLFTDYPEFHVSNEAVKVGGVANLAWRLNNSNKVIYRNTLTRDTDKEARTFRGYNGGLDGVIESTRLRWVERNLYSGSLEGEHSFSGFRNSLIRWQYTRSRSTRDEPDLREYLRGEQFDGSFVFLQQSASRFFNNLRDDISEPLIEWSTLHAHGKFAALLKAGYRGTFRTRDFNGRLFRFLPAQPNNLNFQLPVNQLLSHENIRPNGFIIRESTRGTDTYDAEMDIHGGFFMADLSLGSRWRVNSGLRYEDANTVVTTVDPFVPGVVPAVARLENRDWLPGINLTFAVTPKHNLRFGYGRTLSRPDFRELSPFEFTNVLGGFNTVGNPELKRARIDNFDARWEWFLGGSQVVAISYFRKQFTNPIEVTVQPTTDLRQSFINADSATNQGMELEWRQNLGTYHHALAPFSIQSNFTLVDSNVDLPDIATLLLTSRSRAMVGQSRYVYNVIVDWEKPNWGSSARFFVNTVSRRITDVGTFGLPDIYQEGTTFLDFAYRYSFGSEGRWGIRLTGENLGNSHYLWTQSDLTQRSYRAGRTFSAGLTFSIY